MSKTGRKAQYPISDFMLDRWSPRAMSGESITDQELMQLFEAARWAPSSFNNQPWRFIYAKRNSPSWDHLFNLLVKSNQSWAKNAAVLIVVISHKNFEYDDRPSRTHSFDAGAACENFALQGSLNNLVVHGMEGFNYEQARKDLNVPDDYQVEAMFAIGKHGPLSVLSEELAKREKPSDRKPVAELIFEGKFKTKK
jgi:nitroreductase